MRRTLGKPFMGWFAPGAGASLWLFCIRLGASMDDNEVTLLRVMKNFSYYLSEFGGGLPKLYNVEDLFTRHRGVVFRACDFWIGYRAFQFDLCVDPEMDEGVLDSFFFDDQGLEYDTRRLYVGMAPRKDGFEKDIARACHQWMEGSASEDEVSKILERLI
jgi:hypothetical protein